MFPYGHYSENTLKIFEAIGQNILPIASLKTAALKRAIEEVKDYAKKMNLTPPPALIPEQKEALNKIGRMEYRR